MKDHSPADGLFSHLRAADHPMTALCSPTAQTTKSRGHPVLEDLSSVVTLKEVHDVFAVAEQTSDPQELLQLFVGQVESGRAPVGRWPELARRWSASRRQRQIGDADVFANPATAIVLKSIFDFYFRDDLYGHWKEAVDPIILSSGSFDGSIYGLPASLKDCLRFALDRNWYGYSHSFGRTTAREALAVYETVRGGLSQPISAEEIVITLGGTSAVASVADFLACQTADRSRAALCGVPNYPPLLASIAKRFPVNLVPTPIVAGQTDLAVLIQAARTQNPRLILLQTVTNPTGLRVCEEQIAELVRAAPRDCYIVLDECHNFFGPAVRLTPERSRPNVITVHSLSKLWASPGLKVGWMIVSECFARDFYEHASTMYGGPPSVTYLLLEMFGLFETARMRGELDIASALAQLSEHYQLSEASLLAGYTDYLASFDTLQARVFSARALAVDALRDCGFEVLCPEYSINILTRLGDLPSYQLYRQLISAVGVSVYPGLLCGAGGAGLARISPCVPEPTLLDAVGRLKQWRQTARA